VIAFLSVLLRVLFILFALRLIGRALAALLRGGAEPARVAGRGGALVRDRVCNTFLPREHALTALVAGREEHFCSTACRDRALSSESMG
jgi:hypothetical protein